ncbi:MAG: NUDIX domain-containing protein [Candidatus Omnitrophota bacterium]
MPLYKPYTMVLRGVLQDAQGCFLLMRRSFMSKSWPGRWEFPGGKVDPGEDLGDALVREWREETGLEVVPGQFLEAFEWERESDKVIYLVFRVSSTSRDVQVSDEHEDFGWFKPDEIQKLDVSPSLLTLVRDLK